jgi:hypothetical protein
MDIGETLILEGKRFSVRGFDPAGVEPRFVYVEDTMTGETIAVPFEDLCRVAPGNPVLHLVDDEPS